MYQRKHKSFSTQQSLHVLYGKAKITILYNSGNQLSTTVLPVGDIGNWYFQQNFSYQGSRLLCPVFNLLLHVTHCITTATTTTSKNQNQYFLSFRSAIKHEPIRLRCVAMGAGVGASGLVTGGRCNYQAFHHHKTQMWWPSLITGLQFMTRNITFPAVSYDAAWVTDAVSNLRG